MKMKVPLDVVLLLAVVADPKWEALAQTTKPGDWAEEIDEIEKPVLDPEWREYVDNLAGDYEEVPGPTPTNDEDDFKYRAEFIDWNPTSPREIPFLAIIFARDKGPSEQYKINFPNDPMPDGESHIEPGTACGGALLSPSHILTMCGCIFSVIADVIDEEPLFKWYDTFYPKFNIKNHIIGQGKPPIVFITHSLLRFVPDLKFEIDTQPSHWPKDNVANCKELIKTQARTPDKLIRARRADAKLVVLPFQPATVSSFYPKWPPSPVSKKTDPTYRAELIVASIGMRLTERTKIPFHSSIQVSSLEMKHCPDETVPCNTTVASRDVTHACLCPVNKDKRYQLVGGVIGWPVVDHAGRLAGLTASERNEHDGTILLANIWTEFQARIENYLGRDFLINQNKPPIVYRESDLEKEFNIYDYWAAQYRTAAPWSGADILRIDVFCILTAFFTKICCT